MFVTVLETVTIRSQHTAKLVMQRASRWGLGRALKEQSISQDVMQRKIMDKIAKLTVSLWQLRLRVQVSNVTVWSPVADVPYRRINAVHHPLQREPMECKKSLRNQVSLDGATYIEKIFP